MWTYWFNYIVAMAGSAGKSSKVGVIVGAVVGAIVFFTVLALVLYYFFVYQPKKRQQKGNLSVADPLFIRSGVNYSSASDRIHSSQYRYPTN